MSDDFPLAIKGRCLFFLLGLDILLQRWPQVIEEEIIIVDWMIFKNYVAVE
jgi:hypothetical protein